jgi:hypothetical protein
MSIGGNSPWTIDRIETREIQSIDFGVDLRPPMQLQMDTSRGHSSRRSLALSSVIGRGMPERIRNVGFAILGLTAAAGLALVAVFAQMSFPVLSPAPLPDVPSKSSSVSKAVSLKGSSAKLGLAEARGVRVAADPAAARNEASGGAPARGETRVAGPADPVSSAVSGNSAGSSEPGGASPPAAEPAPAPAPEAPAAAPVETPVSAPSGDEGPKSQPVSSKPSQPGPRPAAAKPPKSESTKPGPVKGEPAKTGRSSKPVPNPVKPEAVPAPHPSSDPAAQPPAPGPKDKAQEISPKSGKGK